MKKEYKKAEIEIIALDGKDVITDSPIVCTTRMKEEEEFE